MVPLDAVAATGKFDETGKGWGRGDIYYAWDARLGNCTDLHAIFIGYARREYLFGTHDENRVEFTRGRDLKLAPLQAGEALNYFYPYAEVDGKPLDNVKVSRKDEILNAGR
jgi:hypothetical protein